MRGETSIKALLGIHYKISIHSPRAGRDPRRSGKVRVKFDFNPLAPCGARPETAPALPSTLYFNPLAPCGARPPRVWSISPTTVFQSTRPVRGETLRDRPDRGRVQISIHSPRAGRDYAFIDFIGLLFQFQSTRPVRGETKCSIKRTPSSQISIHSPRAGRDTEESRLFS